MANTCSAPDAAKAAPTLTRCRPAPVLGATTDTLAARRLEETEQQIRDFPLDESCAGLARLSAATFERRVLAAGDPPVASRDPSAADERDDALAERASAAATEHGLAALAPEVRGSRAGTHAAEDAALHALEANGTCQSIAGSLLGAHDRRVRELREALQMR